jgi:hypothetical protein
MFWYGRYGVCVHGFLRCNYKIVNWKYVTILFGGIIIFMADVCVPLGDTEM